MNALIILNIMRWHRRASQALLSYSHACSIVTNHDQTPVDDRDLSFQHESQLNENLSLSDLPGPTFLEIASGTTLLLASAFLAFWIPYRLAGEPWYFLAPASAACLAAALIGIRTTGIANSFLSSVYYNRDEIRIESVLRRRSYRLESVSFAFVLFPRNGQTRRSDCVVLIRHSTQVIETVFSCRSACRPLMKHLLAEGLLRQHPEQR